MSGIKRILVLAFILSFFTSCVFGQTQKSNQFLVVLGIAQDAGFPQIGSEDEFRQVEKNHKERQKVVSLGLVDKDKKQKFLFETTPDLPAQLFALNKFLP